MSLSHSLAADVLIADISNMLRSAQSFVRQHGNISMLEGFDESTSWFDRLMRRFKRAETAVARTVGQPEVIHLAVLSPMVTLAGGGPSRGPILPAECQTRPASDQP